MVGPPGWLAAVPFHALPVGRQRLGTLVQVRYLPHAGLLRYPAGTAGSFPDSFVAQ